MDSSVRFVPYGRQAAVALRDVVAAAQGDDPLAPVTVVVPRAPVGLAMRRALASGELGPVGGAGARGAGIANVSFTTLSRLAASIGGPVLAAEGRRPLTSAVLGAAARASLADAPGVFAPVAQHPSTALTLGRLWRDLCSASAETRQRLSASNDRAGEVVRLVDDLDGRLAGWYDEHDVALAASRQPAALASIGAVVLHLPERLGPAELLLADALAAHSRFVALLGLTGDDDADDGARALGARWAVGGSFPSDAGVPLPMPTEVVSCPGADVEVLVALRRVMERHRAGTPLHRMAVVYGTSSPYARLLREQLFLDDIAFDGPGVRPLADTVPGRTLVGALGLPDGGWRRSDLLDWLAAAPIRHQGRPVPASRWDRITRAAGIIEGAASWDEHLAQYIRDHEHHIATLAHDDEAAEHRIQQRRREIESAESLRDLVAGLVQRLDPAEPPTRWSSWARWAVQLLSDLLGGPTARQAWPDDELQAFEEIQRALERLALLDEVEPAPDRARFRAALEQELAGTAPTTSRFQSGLLIGPVDRVVGLELDLVVMVGMADGAYPSRQHDEALLPDSERQAAGSDVALRGERHAEQRRDHLAALAAAPERVCCYPRGDLRSGRELRPARWWLEGLAAVRGSDHPVYSRDLDAIGSGPSHPVIASHLAAVRSGGEAVAPSDHDQRLLVRHHDTGTPIRTHWLAENDPVLRRGLAVRLDRRRGRYGPATGRAGARTIPREGPLVVSPTALETYATCPRRYLLGRVLRIEQPDRPEQRLRLDGLDRGKLVHEVLETLVRTQTELPLAERLAPDASWGEGGHRALDEIFDDAAARLEQAGLTGHPVLWEVDREVTRRELHRLLDADDEHRRTRRATPHAVEQAFGMTDDPPVPLELGGGRAVAFRGFVDRIDVTEGGGVLALDYKHARNKQRYQAIQDDPVDRGQRLQPVIYGLAARRELGDAPVDSGYWLTTEVTDFARLTVPLDDATLTRAREVLSVLVDGIDSGDFPARPGTDSAGRHTNCYFCDFNDLCPASRDDEWEGVRTDGRLAAYVELSEGER